MIDFFNNDCAETAVCNKKHPNFQVIDVESKKKFFDSTGFRIDAQTKIEIK